MCWWCCMRVLEKCLPRNDIVRELAPYLQHVHHDEGLDDDTRARGETWGRPVASPRNCDFANFDDKNSVTSSDSFRQNPGLYPVHSRSSMDEAESKQLTKGPEMRVSFGNEGGPSLDVKSQQQQQALARKRKCNNSLTNGSMVIPPQLHQRPAYAHLDSSGCKSSTDSGSDSATVPITPLQKKVSMAKIKTDLGDLIPVRWDKVVIVQVSVQGFREMATQAKDLMEEAKLLYEHTVLSRLSSEYGGQEILSHSRSGLFVIAFASEFHAAKWCLSLQLSLVYAAWNDKLLKRFDDMKETYVKTHGKSKKNMLLYRGFRVRMVIHTADPDDLPEKSLSDAVKWTKTVSEYAHGGQIILSDNVWDRLKEQLVQLGNPVVEDLGCHSVLGDEVMLMLLLPRDLECRRFPSLKSPHQLSLGMRDAPSAQKPVTMVFTFIEGARPLVRCHAEELADRIKTLCMVARELLRKHNGYECQELQGDFMLAFFNPHSAILWCGEFQLRIRQKFREWNRESENQELMFSMSMGIETGVPASVSPHKTSGRADYFGNIVNQTARIAKAAYGGQILIGGDAWNTFQGSPCKGTAIVPSTDTLQDAAGSTVFQFKFHGYYSFKGISSPIGLIEAIPVDVHSSKLTLELATRGHGRLPKAKHLDDAQLKTQKVVPISPVPTEMTRLTHAREKPNDSIRETEYGFNVSWEESVVMIEEDSDEENDVGSRSLSGSDTLALQANHLNHPAFQHLLRVSVSLSSSTASPRAAQAEEMDRV